MKKKTMNRKGFSLVELIIVIAIMAVMIGVLAPQYLKFTTNARVSTDVTNAQQMANMVNAAIADDNGSSIPSVISGAGGTTISGIQGVEMLPYCKVDASYVWRIETTTGQGVEKITLNSFAIYSRTGLANDYYDQYYVD